MVRFTSSFYHLTLYVHGFDKSSATTVQDERKWEKVKP